MELLSPAGNLEKLRTAYSFGADAAYTGVSGFSLRAYADTLSADLSETDSQQIAAIKGDRLLYAALNMSMHRKDLEVLPAVLRQLALLPIDALIVADIGIIDLVRRYLPDIDLHLSTQANCTNAEAARMYHRMGFSRIIPARELTLDEVAEIKQRVPELELEVFVHGAMCMAYSGRCFLSSHLTGRSANRGDCTQPCRWKYALSEEKRPGEFIPIESDGRLLTILSSRDLMVLDHLAELRNAGVDAVKIEGRMKSSYYVAVVTRAYRAAIDELAGKPTTGQSGEDAAAMREDLFLVSHREYTTGFLFGDRTVHRHSTQTNPHRYRMLGIITEAVSTDRYRFAPKNRINSGSPVDFIRPFAATVHEPSVALYDLSDRPVEWVVHGQDWILASKSKLEPGTIIRGPWYNDAL